MPPRISSLILFVGNFSSLVGWCVAAMVASADVVLYQLFKMCPVQDLLKPLVSACVADDASLDLMISPLQYPTIQIKLPLMRA